MAQSRAHQRFEPSAGLKFIESAEGTCGACRSLDANLSTVVTRRRLGYFKPMQLTHDEITRLSPDERLALIAQLWDSLDDHQVQLTPAQQAELERRLTTLDHDRTRSVTWETLKAELEQRCP